MAREQYGYAPRTTNSWLGSAGVSPLRSPGQRSAGVLSREHPKRARPSKIVIAIRENTNIQRLMPVDLRMAIALRDTDAQVVAAQRLVAELDTTASAR
jgi:hypothetical protein